MSQEYKLKTLKIGDDPYTDPYGNTWVDAVFEGYGSPVKWVVKDPASIMVGENYYGHMEEKTSKAGKPYTRFYKDPRPDGAPRAAQSPGYAEGQAWGNALTNAVATIALTSPSKQSLEHIAREVVRTAQFYYNSRATQPSPETPAVEPEKPVEEDFVPEEIDDKPIDMSEIPF